MGFGTSLFLIAVGAIMTFAVTVEAEGFNINTVGIILMIIGGIGLLASLVFWSTWGGFQGTTRRRRRVVDDEY